MGVVVHSPRLNKMMLNLCRFLSIVFVISITSCANVSDDTRVVIVDESEILLVLNKSKTDIYLKGEYSINKDSKTILFDKTDSLVMKEFDIMDMNNQTLYCKPTVIYSLTPYHVKNIAEKFEWINDMSSYKSILIGPEIRSIMRNLGFQSQQEQLISLDIVKRSDINDIIATRLENFIQLKSVDFNINKTPVK
jgi:hypothetical protein